MENSDIVEMLELTARLMELHDQDAFKTRAFQTAAFNLDRTTDDFTQLSAADLTNLPGVGKSVAGKIREFIDTGHLTDLDTLLAQTPEGVLAMFRIKGIGVKKIGTLWRELGIETLDALRRAAESGQIASLKGFGEKMQEKILASLDFLDSLKGKIRLDKADQLTHLLHDQLTAHFDRVEISGQVRRRAPEINTVQFLIESGDPISAGLILADVPGLAQDAVLSSPFAWRGQHDGYDVGVEIRTYPRETFDNQLFLHSATEAHLGQNGTGNKTLLEAALTATDGTDAAIYARAGLPYIVPEMREDDFAFRWASHHQPDELITWDDLRGTLHNHSTWSDGKNTIAEMAAYTRELGLDYFGKIGRAHV